MKKMIALLLAAALLLTTAGCKKSEETPRTELTKPTQDAQAAPEEPEKEPEEVYEAAPVTQDDFPEYGFDVSSEIVISMVNFVAPFNDLPQEFTQVSELTDETMFYAAVGVRGPLFSPSQDGTYSTLPIAELKDGVRQMFGEDAALSDDYASKDYSPYQIDIENDVVIRGNFGGLASYFFPWAVTKDDDGSYKLYLLDLLDPLYYNAETDAEILFAETPVSVDMVRDIAPEMQCNVYTIRPSSGNFCLAGFQYLNYKGVEHWIF